MSVSYEEFKQASEAELKPVRREGTIGAFLQSLSS